MTVARAAAAVRRLRSQGAGGAGARGMAVFKDRARRCAGSRGRVLTGSRARDGQPGAFGAAALASATIAAAASGVAAARRRFIASRFLASWSGLTPSLAA